MSPIPALDVAAFSPLLVCAAGAMVVLLAGTVLRDGRGRIVQPLACLVLLATLVAWVLLWGPVQRSVFPLAGEGPLAAWGMLQQNNYAVVAGAAISLIALLVVMLSRDYVVRIGAAPAEYYALVLFAALGMLVLAAATDLVAMLVGLELVSIALYVLVGVDRHNDRSLEASLKYFILGSFASAFLIFGLAFVYGATGTTQLGLVREAIVAGTAQRHFLLAGFGLLLFGFGFKVALVPFHLWAPDVYDGAPAPVAGLVATAAKIAGFAALLHVIVGLQPFLAESDTCLFVLWIVALLSMLVGNLLGLVQQYIKRLLAYSSIAHGGYVTLALLVAATANPDGAGLGAATTALLFYVISYALMTLLAFGVCTALAPHGETNLEHYAGLSQRDGGLAALMAIAMLALTGLPLTAGFTGKFLLFASAVREGYLVLAVLGVLSSVLSAYYYLRVIVLMYFHDPAPEVELPVVRPFVRVPLVICAALVLLLGIYPLPLLQVLGRVAANVL